MMHSATVSGSAALASQPVERSIPAEPAGEVIQFPSVPVTASLATEITPPNHASESPESPASPTGESLVMGAPDPDQVKLALVTALTRQGHDSASQLISTGRLTLEATNLRIEVPGIGRKMLSLTVNAAAEKIIRQELQKLGGPARFMVLPGEGAASTLAVTAPPVGSIQQAALEHPMVQRAKEIFNAEVRSVVDLRSK